MSAYTGDIVKDGLVLALDAANYKSFVSGSTIWFDLSRLGNTGSLINGPAYTGSNKGAIVFDGTNDYVLVNSNAASIPYGSSARTVSIWFYTNTTTWAENTNNLFFYGAGSNGNAFGIDFGLYPVMEFYSWGGSGRDLIWNTTYEQVGWKNITITYNGSTSILIYENGNLTQTLTLSAACNTTTSNIFIGSINPALQSWYFDGRISQTLLYNRALSAAEVRENYNATKGRYDTTRSSDAIKPRLSTSGLVLHLDAANYRSFVSGSTTWRDLSGRNNNATLASSTNRPTYLNVNAGVISFDGADDYCFITANSDFAYGTNSFTIEAFIYATTLAQTGTYDGHIIYSQTISGTNYLVFDINSTGTIGWISTASGGGTRLSSAAGAVKSQTWHHVVASRIGTNLKLYVDGVSVAEQTNTFDFSNTTYNPTIGNYTHTYGQLPFSGYIPIVRVYKGVGLTANEVIQNRNILKSRFNLP